MKKKNGEFTLKELVEISKNCGIEKNIDCKNCPLSFMNCCTEITYVDLDKEVEVEK